MKYVMQCVFLLLSVMVGFGGSSSHETRVDDDMKHFEWRHDEILKRAEEIDAALKARNVESTAIVETTNMLSVIVKDAAWRDVSSRTTAKRKKAIAKIEDGYKRIEGVLAKAQKQLDTLKEAEYQAWARKNPEAAKRLELEAAILNAQNEASQSSSDAQQAMREAEEAKAEANNARMEAEQARRNAAAAQQRAQEAEDELQLQKMSW